MSDRAGEIDLCVIGGSEAGVAACAAAAALSLSVTLVDDGDPSGLRNPDLLLEILHQAASGEQHGAFEWPALMRMLHRAAAERRHARLAAMNVHIVAARGRFGDGGSVVAGRRLIAPRRTILAVGGRQPAAHLSAAIEPTRCLTIAGLADIKSRPERVVVVGGTAAAVSAAQSLQRLGSRTVLAADRLLPGMDDEFSSLLASQLSREGVSFQIGSRPVLCRPGHRGVDVTLADGTVLHASHLLLAEDTEPALAGLDLARAGIAATQDGLVLNDCARTTNPRVFAVGRAAGATSTAAGVNEVGNVLRAAFLPLRFRHRPVPAVKVAVTEPQVATVGLSEQAAALRGPIQVWRWPLAQTGLGSLAHPPAGYVKIVADRRGRVLGAGLIGPDVREMLGFWSLAIARRLTLAQLADVPMPMPSRSEAARALALSALAARLRHPLVGGALRFARWLG